MTTTPVRYDRLQAGLVASVRAAVGEGPVIVWGRQNLPRGAAPADLVMLEALDEPSSGDTDVTAELPMAATITVAGAGPVRLDVCGGGIEVTGASATAVRDELLERLAVVCPDAPAEASGAAALTISARDVGDLRGLSVGPGLTLEVTETAIARVAVERVTIRVAVDFFSRATSPRSGSRRLAARWRAWLGGPAADLVHAAHDLAIEVVSFNPIDGLAGPEHESRTRVAVDVSVPSFWAELVDTVETATATLETR